MSSPIHRQVLTPKKPLWLYKIEKRIESQEDRIKVLESALEQSNSQNKRLMELIERNAASLDNENKEDVSPALGVSPQFRMSF